MPQAADRRAPHARPPRRAGVLLAACAAACIAGFGVGCHRASDTPSLDTGRDNAPVVAALVIPGGARDRVDPADANAAPQADSTGGNSKPQTRYAQAFVAARDELRDLGFILERVDAQAGVIETRPKGTGGIATPWDAEQTTFEQELQDAAQRQRRVARVEFTPIGADPQTEPDLRRFAERGGDVEMRAAVTVYRWHNSSWQLNTSAVLYSNYAQDVQLAERGMTTYGVAFEQDALLASRIVRSVREHLDIQSHIPEPPASAPAPAAPPAEAPPQIAPLAPPPVAPPAPTPSPAPAKEPEWRKGEPIKRP